MSAIYSKRQIDLNNKVLLKFAENPGKFKLKVDRHDYFYLQKKSTPKVLRWLDRWDKELSTRKTPTREKIARVFQETRRCAREHNQFFLTRMSSKINEIESKNNQLIKEEKALKKELKKKKAKNDKEELKTKIKDKEKQLKEIIPLDIKKIRTSIANYLPNKKQSIEEGKKSAINKYQQQIDRKNFILDALLKRLTLKDKKPSESKIEKNYKNLRKVLKKETKKQIKIIETLAKKRANLEKTVLKDKKGRANFSPLRKQIKSINLILNEKEEKIEKTKKTKKKTKHTSKHKSHHSEKKSSRKKR